MTSDWFLEHDDDITALKRPPDLNEHLWDVVEPSENLPESAAVILSCQRQTLNVLFVMCVLLSVS